MCRIMVFHIPSAQHSPIQQSSDKIDHYMFNETYVSYEHNEEIGSDELQWMLSHGDIGEYEEDTSTKRGN